MSIRHYGRYFLSAFGKTKHLFLVTAKKLPTFAWGMWAVLGILMVGILIGYLWGSDPDATTGPVGDLKNEKQELLNLVDGYEELSQIYHDQGKNVNIVTDLDLLGRDPGRVARAFSDLEYNRNLINIQLGRIIELRRNANLSSEKKY